MENAFIRFEYQMWPDALKSKSSPERVMIDEWWDLQMLAKQEDDWTTNAFVWPFRNNKPISQAPLLDLIAKVPNLCSVRASGVRFDNDVVEDIRWEISNNRPAFAAPLYLELGYVVKFPLELQYLQYFNEKKMTFLEIVLFDEHIEREVGLNEYLDYALVVISESVYLSDLRISVHCDSCREEYVGEFLRELKPVLFRTRLGRLTLQFSPTEDDLDEYLISRLESQCNQLQALIDVSQKGVIANLVNFVAVLMSDEDDRFKATKLRMLPMDMLKHLQPFLVSAFGEVGEEEF